MGVEAHLSWNGYNIAGDERSISAVQTLMDEAIYDSVARKAFADAARD